MAAIPVDQLERLHRIARLDGFDVRKAETRAQARAWGGALAVFQGESFLYSADSTERVRGWLHVVADRRQQ